MTSTASSSSADQRLVTSQLQPEIAVLYITERILVLTFPASSSAASRRRDDSVTAAEELAYRSSVRHVSRMLHTKHGDNYKIFNLSRRRRDLCQYNPYVVEFGWPVHQAPPLERLCALCKDIDGWLNRDAQNIALLHEKPGANRAAMAVAIFMHYCSISASDDQALDRFAMRKFYNEYKVQPSQKRYVSYFAGLLAGQIKINSAPIYLYQIVVYGLPVGSRPYLKFYEKMVPVLTTGAYKIQNPVLTARLQPPLALRGDVLVECCEMVALSSVSGGISSTTSTAASDWQNKKPILLFSCQFNTCAVDPRGAPCVSFSARELDLTLSGESGLDLLYSFDKDFKPVGELATVVEEDKTATLAYRSNSYDKFDRFAEDDAPSAPQPTGEPNWTGHSPLVNGSSSQQQKPTNDRADYRNQQQYQANLIRETSANDTADSGIHSVADGDSSGGTAQSTLENVVVESQAKRAELVDQNLASKPRYQIKSNHMESLPSEAYVNKDRAPAAMVDDQAKTKVERSYSYDTKVPNGPVTPTPSSEYGSRGQGTLYKEPVDVDTGEIEFPHRPPPLTAPSRRPFTPQHRPVSPSSLSAGANLTQDGREIDAELVEEGRYDPQSKAFSYVPAKSLEDHFKAPKQQTKLVLKAEPTQAASLNALPAPPPVTDNDFADLETAVNVTQFEPRQMAKRPKQQQQTSTPPTQQRKRSTSATRTTPLADEEMDKLLDPAFYLNFQGDPSAIQQQPESGIRQTQKPLVTPRKQPQPPPKPSLASGEGNDKRGPPFAADDLAAFDDLVAYGMKHSGSGFKPIEERRQAIYDEPGNKFSMGSGAPQQQKPLAIANKVPPHLDTRRGWEPPKRGSGLYTEDDLRWDQVFDDFEKRFIKYPEPKERKLASTGASKAQPQNRPWTTAPSTPVLQTRHNQQQPPKGNQRSFGESLMRALGPEFMDDSRMVTTTRTPPAGLPIRPSTAMGFQSRFDDDQDSFVQQSTPLAHPYVSSPDLAPGTVRKTKSIPDDYGVEYSGYPSGHRARAQSGGSDVDWLSRQMEKLRVRREMNDPILQQRKEQEKMLLDELRHVHEDRMIKRNRSEADYSVEGVGVRTVEPGSEEDLWQRQQQQQQQQPQHRPQHPAPTHLLYRPQSEQHAPPPEAQAPLQPLTYFASEPDAILLRREIITNPSESPFLAKAAPELFATKPKSGNGFPYPTPYEQQQSQPLHNGGNSRSQAPDKPLDFHRLQEVLWDAGNYGQQHPASHHYAPSSISSRTVSSPRSILKKPKPSPVESQQTDSTLVSTPSRFYSQQTASPYSQNGFHDLESQGTRVCDLESTEMDFGEPTRIAPQGYRAETPAFPVRGETPLPYHPFLYSGADLESRGHPVLRTQLSGPPGMRSPSPASQYYAQSRRSSLTSLLEPMDIVHHHPVFVKDTSKYWYKPHISREEAIAVLKDKPPGTFIIRDSNSFPGAFGLALKVATPPPGVQTRTNDGSELVRHFLIEPTAKGVKLKGCNNEPIFGSLAALVYQHSITPLALPSKLLLPEYDPAASSDQIGSAQALLEQGAACNVTYLHSCDTESLTGPEAVRRAVDQALFAAQQKQLTPVSVHFKVSTQGITVTDNTRKLFFRRHYPVSAVTFCGLDPEERRWTVSSTNAAPVRIFGFVARKIANRTENACHIFAELEPEQPATAIVNFVTKVMMAPLQQHQHHQQRLVE